jgi:hypothetical protein
MCILITVVDDGGRLFGVSSMSSNNDRISNGASPQPDEACLWSVGAGGSGRSG